METFLDFQDSTKENKQLKPWSDNWSWQSSNACGTCMPGHQPSDYAWEGLLYVEGWVSLSGKNQGSDIVSSVSKTFLGHFNTNSGIIQGIFYECGKPYIFMLTVACITQVTFRVILEISEEHHDQLSLVSTHFNIPTSLPRFRFLSVQQIFILAGDYIPSWCTWIMKPRCHSCGISLFYCLTFWPSTIYHYQYLEDWIKPTSFTSEQDIFFIIPEFLVKF